MTKRNITIIGIVLILIASAIIGVVRSRVRASSALGREPVALNVGSGGGGQANLARSVQREVPVDVGELVNTSAVRQAVDALGVTRMVGTVSRLLVQQERGVKLAVVSRAVVTGVDRVRGTLV
jgi:hypothetical protein